MSGLTKRGRNIRDPPSLVSGTGTARPSPRPNGLRTPDRQASRDDSGAKPLPDVTSRHVTTSSIRPATESMVTISAAEYRELQKQARELRQLRDRPVFPDPPARRSEPDRRED